MEKMALRGIGVQSSELNFAAKNDEICQEAAAGNSGLTKATSLVDKRVIAVRRCGQSQPEWR
jgi:hypothetical protein